jgi:hypothetical protein
VPISGLLQAGAHNVLWNGQATSGDRLREGIYFARPTTEAGVRTLKIVGLGR